MSCNTMQINNIKEQIKRETIKREEIKRAKEQAASRKEMDEIDQKIADLQAKVDQLIKDDEDFHKALGDAQAQTHLHLNLDS
jgi:hypothetical protein